MVLVFGGRTLDSAPTSLVSLFEDNSALLEGAKTLATRKKRFLGPQGVLYARQKEFVVAHRGERFPESEGGQEVAYVGTEDVLTCHVVVLHDWLTAVTALAHFDEYVTDCTINKLIDAFVERARQRMYSSEDTCEDSSEEDDWEWESVGEEEEEEQNYTNIIGSQDYPITLHLVGGYDDESGKAHRLSMRLLGFLHAHNLCFELATCCLGVPNTRLGMYGRNEPLVGGVAVAVGRKQGVPIPAAFNRVFVSPEMDEDVVRTLLLGPALIKQPMKLKALIRRQEDRGYARRSAAA